MLKSIFVILFYQLIGEFTHKFLELSIPGPVIGLLLLLFTLLLLKKLEFKVNFLAKDLFNSAESLLDYLPLLFIPVGVGVVMHLSFLEDNLVSVLLVIILGTLLTLGITGFIMEKILTNSKSND